MEYNRKVFKILNNKSCISITEWDIVDNNIGYMLVYDSPTIHVTEGDTYTKSTITIPKTFEVSTVYSPSTINIPINIENKFKELYENEWRIT